MENTNNAAVEAVLLKPERIMAATSSTLVCHLDCNGASTFCILIPAMLPVMLGIGQAFGLETLPIAITMQILRLSATFICPMTAALLLATGMADVPIRNHIKASALYVWSFSFLCLVFAIFIGLVPF